MNKIILSFILIALAGTTVVSTTKAWFTDRSTVSDNTFASSTLDFHLDGDMTESKKINVVNLTPGKWSSNYTMNIDNANSTIPIKYRFYDANGSDDTAGLYDLLKVKVINTFCNDVIYNSWEGKLADLNWNSISSSTSQSLGVNNTHCFKFSFSLDSSAGNVYQNKNATFDLVVDGTQVDNPGWAE